MTWFASHAEQAADSASNLSGHQDVGQAAGEIMHGVEHLLPQPVGRQMRVAAVGHRRLVLHEGDSSERCWPAKCPGATYRKSYAVMMICEFFLSLWPVPSYSSVRPFAIAADDWVQYLSEWHGQASKQV